MLLALIHCYFLNSDSEQISHFLLNLWMWKRSVGTYLHIPLQQHRIQEKKDSLSLREGSLFPFKCLVLQVKGSYTECPKMVFSTGAFSLQDIPVQWQAGAVAGSICYLLAGAMHPLPGVTAHQWVRKRNAVSWLFNIVLWSHTQELPGVQCTILFSSAF